MPSVQCVFGLIFQLECLSGVSLHRLNPGMFLDQRL